MNTEILGTIGVSIGSFGVGTIFGYILRGVVAKLDKGTRHEAEVVLVAVTVMWVISVAWDIISPTYETSPFIHGLMGAIVGFFYTKRSNPNNEK